MRAGLARATGMAGRDCKLQISYFCSSFAQLMTTSTSGGEESAISYGPSLVPEVRDIRGRNYIPSKAPQSVFLWLNKFSGVSVLLVRPPPRGLLSTRASVQS